MRLIERNEPEQNFVEGEPDLEAPEELASYELDDQAVLEADLDNEDVSEDDVDEEVLTDSLEHLVHPDGEEEGEDGELTVALALAPAQGDDPDADWDLFDLEDVEESLDAILRVQVAAGELEDPDDDGTASAPASSSGAMVLTCGEDEFVCRRCWLVANRTRLADVAAGVCVDCVD